MRFIRVISLVVLLAAMFAGRASALAFDGDSEQAPRGEVGALYHFDLNAHAGCDSLPYRFVVQSGVLPPGLTLSPRSRGHTGLIDGVPTEGGIFSAWIALQDHCGGSSERLFTFEIWNRRFSIATDTLKSAAVGSSYYATLETAGVPSNVTWTLTSGTLPAGLTLQPSGVISGSPTSVGSSAFALTATGMAKDFNGTRVDSKQYTINVRKPLAASTARRVGEVGVPFRARVKATGGQGPYAWSAAPGALPAGLSLGTDGVLSGVPTAPGSYGVRLQLVDADGSAKDVEVALRVRARLAIATKRLPAAAVGRAYRAKIAIRGGVPALKWRVVRGSLPRGLKLDARTGTVAGRPTGLGASRVTVRVRDSLGGTSTKTFVLSVHA